MKLQRSMTSQTTYLIIDIFEQFRRLILAKLFLGRLQNIKTSLRDLDKRTHANQCPILFLPYFFLGHTIKSSSKQIVQVHLYTAPVYATFQPTVPIKRIVVQAQKQQTSRLHRENSSKFRNCRKQYILPKLQPLPYQP